MPTPILVNGYFSQGQTNIRSGCHRQHAEAGDLVNERDYHPLIRLARLKNQCNTAYNFPQQVSKRFFAYPDKEMKMVAQQRPGITLATSL